MSAADAQTNAYMSDNAHFADVFNYFIYGGRQVIRPENLQEMDRTALTMPFGSGKEASEEVQKFRDVLKSVSIKMDESATYLLMGIENQSHIHYAMPVRNMLYDAISYADQVEAFAKRHREDKEYGSSDEYLSGFHRGDMLRPVITLVIYWAPGKWDGPQSIHELLETQNPDLLKLVPDYRMNLLVPDSIEDFEKFRTELAEVLEFIKYSKDSEKLYQAINETPGFQKLGRRSVELINAVTDADIEIPEGKEAVNMCTAIQEMKEESRNIGVKEGQAKMIQQALNHGSSVEQIANALALSVEEVTRLSKN